MRPPGWSALVAAEWLKVRTVRVPAWLVAVAVGLTMVLAVQHVLGAGRRGSPSLGTAGAMLAVLDASSRGPLIALVFGVLLVTSEHHHATITPVLLQTPSRLRLLTAKASLAVLGGLALGLVGLATVLAVGVPTGAIQADLLNSDVVRRAVGLVLAHPAYALLGVGVGALVARSQPIAVLLPVAWLLFGEGMLVAAVDRHLVAWSLGGATAALANAGDLAGVLPMWAGGLLLLGCAGAAVAGGAARLVREDLT